MQKNILIFVVIVLMAAGGAFFAGVEYQKNKSPFAGDFSNLSQAERQQRFAEMGAGRIAGTGAETRQAGAGLLTGEIIAKDEQTITLKLVDGSSKIILFSAATVIQKTISGDTANLQLGENIAVSGRQNNDGSFTANNIQIGQTGPVRFLQNLNN